MNNSARYTMTAVAVCVICATAFGWYAHKRPGVSDQRPEFTLTDLHGVPRSITSFDGKVLVINFWATWCAPCRKEIPMLVEMQQVDRSRGLQVIGVAIDKRRSVKTFAKKFNVNYPLLAAPIEGARIQDEYTGNTPSAGGLPFTAIVNRKGRIVARIAGAMTKAQLNARLRPLLNQPAP